MSDLTTFKSNASGTPPQEPIKGVSNTGFPTEGGAGIEPTIPGAYWFYQIQQEINNAIKNNGINPNINDLSQLSKAISSKADASMNSFKNQFLFRNWTGTATLNGYQQWNRHYLMIPCHSTSGNKKYIILDYRINVNTHILATTINKFSFNYGMTFDNILYTSASVGTISSIYSNTMELLESAMDADELFAKLIYIRDSRATISTKRWLGYSNNETDKVTLFATIIGTIDQTD